MISCEKKPLVCFHFYNDPGHGWMKTTRETLIKYGVMDKISQYSYQKGPFVWLEEDCDAPTLIKAVEANGAEVKLFDHYCNSESHIRKLYPFTSDEEEIAILKAMK
jgi:hypothetical protein